MGTAPRAIQDESPQVLSNTWSRPRCVNGACFKVRLVGDARVEIGSTKLTHLGDEEPTILASVASYLTLTDQLAGASPPDQNLDIDVTLTASGEAILRSRHTGVAIQYDADEVNALAEATRRGEMLPA